MIVVTTGTPSSVKEGTAPQTYVLYQVPGKKPVGRPSALTPDVVRKLEEAFAIDCTVEEACFYAGISRPTFYKIKEDNEELFDRLQSLRNRPVLVARQTVATSLVAPEYAFKFLTHKRPDEYSPKTKVEHSGKVETDTPSAAAVAGVVAEFEEKLRQAIVDSTKQTP